MDKIELTNIINESLETAKAFDQLDRIETDDIRKLNSAVCDLILAHLELYPNGVVMFARKNGAVCCKRINEV